MTTIIDAVKDNLQMNLDDEPTNPMHVGEVMNTWLYLTIMDEAAIYIQIGLNTTTDDDVKQMLQDSLKQWILRGKDSKSLWKRKGYTCLLRVRSVPNQIQMAFL
ncbi:hypothetical protein [Niallia sp. 03133]|uniref:hypothetical protein n=1 Tax=Niallia sp. 03133 TaxID=3458060 RepID=UPI0040441470